jgi:predicted permease
MSVLSDLIERVRAIVFRRRDERELAEELRFHLEMETERLRGSGLSGAEARRRGHIALGGAEAVKDDVRDARGTRWLYDSLGDIRFSLRTLRQNPGFTIVAVLTLAIGIGGTTAVFSAVDAVLLQPLPYQDPGQLVRLYQSYGKEADIHGFVTPVHFLDYRARLASFTGVAAEGTYSDVGADIGTGAEAHRVRLLPISADYFDVVRVHPLLGHAFERNDETGAALVVLSHDLWAREMRSDPNAIGRTLTMSGRPYTVTGVMPAGFTDPIAGAVDAWVPYDLAPGRDLSNASNHYLTVIARLRANVSLVRAQAELDALGAILAKQYPDARDKRARLYPLKQDIVGSSTRALGLMLGAALLVLLLVCVNIANLLLVRGADRAHEFALRAALGAKRGRLVRQLLIESLALAIVGDVAGLAVARGAMSAIAALGADSLPRLSTLALDPRLLAFSLIVTSLAAVGFGLLPALRAASTDPSDVLRENSRTGTAGRGQMRLRSALVTSQIAFAFVLLVGAGLLIASFQRIRAMDLGVRADGVLVFDLELPSARYDSTRRASFYETLASRLAAIPGVRAAGGVSRLPATGQYHQWGVDALTGALANTREGSINAENRVVSGDYFRAAGIPLVDGRLFDTHDDALAPGHVVVSKSLAHRLFPNARAMGQRLRTGGREAEIVGVVGDVAIDAEGATDRYVYHAHTQFAGDRNWPLVQVISADRPQSSVQGEASKVLASLDPQLVMYRPMTLAAAIGRGEAQRAFTLALLTTFAAIALAIAGLGLFGVLSYGVRMRSREFGIRMALGAERGAIRGMVLRDGLVVTAWGMILGLAGALALTRVIASMMFHVSPLDPTVLVAAMLFMTIVGCIAAYVPAFRATRVDPRRALQ